MNELIKYQQNEIVKKDGAVRVTNKLLALVEPQLIPYRKGDKWGFCTPDKKIVIDCVYDWVENFVDGYSEIRMGYNYGVINIRGEVVIPIEFNSIYRIWDTSFFKVRKTMKWNKEWLRWKKGEEFYGLYKNNKLVLPIAYDEIKYDTIGKKIMASIRYGEWLIFDENFKQVIFDTELRKYNDNKNPPEYLTENICSHKYDGMSVYIDGKKKEIPLKLGDWIDLICVYNKIYFYSYYEKYRDEYEYVLFDEFFEVVNLPSDFLIKRLLKQESCYPFIIIEDERGIYHVFDENLRHIKTLSYKVWDFNDGYACICENISGKRKFGIINSNFEVVIECLYDWISDFDKYGLARVKLDNKYGYINTNGDLIIPFNYFDVGILSQGLCFVRLSKESSESYFINTRNEIVLKCNYELPEYIGSWEKEKYKLNTFNEFGTAIVWKNGKGMGMINRNGEEILECKYIFEDGTTFYNKIEIITTRTRIINEKGLKGIVNYNGEILVPLIYEKIHEEFEFNGCYYFSVRNSEGYKGYIDSKGNHFWED